LLLNEILPGNLQCTCTFTTSLKFGCKGFDELCLSDNGYCSTPTVSGQLDLLSLSVTFKFCGFNATNNGRPVPGICINVGGTLVPPGFPIPNAKGEIKPSSPPIRGANQTSSTVTTGGTLPSLSSKMTSVLGTCSATNIYGKECKSCNICNQGQGYTSDCSNIGRRVVQSRCTPLSIVSNLRLDQNITFLPRLDPVPVAALVSPPTAAPETKTSTKTPSKAPKTKAPVQPPTAAPQTKAPVKIPNAAPKAPTSGWGGLFAGWPGAPTIIP
jgi:hypothetical protein